jgi:hypothetical protein
LDENGNSSTVNIIQAEGLSMGDGLMFRPSPQGHREQGLWQRVFGKGVHEHGPLKPQEGLWLLPENIVDAAGERITFHCKGIFGCTFDYALRDKFVISYTLANRNTLPPDGSRLWQQEWIDWVSVHHYYKTLFERLIVEER